jgi:hypothetical protein
MMKPPVKVRSVRARAIGRRMYMGCLAFCVSEAGGGDGGSGGGAVCAAVCDSATKMLVSIFFLESSTTTAGLIDPKPIEE